MTQFRYRIHPAAKLLPAMTAEEFAALKADIKRYGWGTSTSWTTTSARSLHDRRRLPPW